MILLSISHNTPRLHLDPQRVLFQPQPKLLVHHLPESCRLEQLLELRLEEL
jgi:hypothetical protein